MKARVHTAGLPENPLVSVVVITYNLSAFVKEAVESALTQTYQPIEVIVVDDGSQDSTREVLTPYFGRIKYIYQENQGGTVARNVAIAASHGDYIALLDADDLWLPTKLAEQVDFLRHHPDVGLVASHVIAIDIQGRPISREPVYSDWHANIVSIEQIFLNSPLTASSIVVRRECLPTPFAFDPSWYFGDWAFCLEVAANHRVGFVDKVLVHYRVLATSMSAMLATQDLVDLKYKDRMDILKKFLPLVRDQLADPESLMHRVEARESVFAAIPSYANGAFDTAMDLLTQVIQLDSSDWYSGGELADQISHYAKILFQSGGAQRCLDFLGDLFSHLPDNLPNQEQLKRIVYGRVHIFVIASDSYHRGDLLDARVNIAKGIRYDRSHLRNRGVLLTLAKCFWPKSASTSRGIPKDEIPQAPHAYKWP